MYCRYCEHTISESDINPDTLIATCGKCRGIFSFADVPDLVAKYRYKQKDTALTLPGRIYMDSNETGLEIGLRWFDIQSSNMVLLIFIVIWDIIGIKFLMDIFSRGHFADLMIFFCSFGIIPMLLTYIGVTILVNSTVFFVDLQSISIRHKPLFWPGNRNIPSSDIVQLYCKVDNNRQINHCSTYCLKARLKNRQEVGLLYWLESPEYALFIEKEIEKYLEIADRPVDGELLKKAKYLGIADRSVDGEVKKSGSKKRRRKR